MVRAGTWAAILSVVLAAVWAAYEFGSSQSMDRVEQLRDEVSAVRDQRDELRAELERAEQRLEEETVRHDGESSADASTVGAKTSSAPGEASEQGRVTQADDSSAQIGGLADSKPASVQLEGHHGLNLEDGTTAPWDAVGVDVGFLPYSTLKSLDGSSLARTATRNRPSLEECQSAFAPGPSGDISSIAKGQTICARTKESTYALLRIDNVVGSTLELTYWLYD